jgi:4-amino-4-deoxy-L-arabinose transferase-like glycosyltransferase
MQILKVIKKNGFLKLIFIIFFIASTLRLFDLNSNPKALYGDELTMVYDAYSISKTLHDQKGEMLPLAFQLGAARPPGYVYATVPFAALLGPNGWSARLVSALSGIGVVVLIYLLTKLMLNKQIALLAAFLAAISTWGISLSRAGFESNFALFLALLGVYCFYKGLLNPRWFLGSSLSFALSMQTYPIFRMTIPLFLVITIWLYWRDFKKLAKSKLIAIFSIAILLFSIGLSLYLTISLGSNDRFSTINILHSDELETATQIDSSKRDFINLPKEITYIFHNKFIETGTLLMKNYLDYLSPNFLFISGDRNPRHNPAGMGQLYWINLILLVFAFRNIFRSPTKPKILLISWILLSPIAGSLIANAHALRSSFMMPPLLILSALGITEVLKLNGRLQLYRKTILLIIFSLLLVQFVFLIERVFFLAPNFYSNFWSYPAKQATQIALRDQAKFSYIILSNDIDNMEYAYPTYSKVDPNLVINQNRKRESLGGYEFFKYDNIFIGSVATGDIDKFLDSLTGPALYIAPAEYKNDPNVSPRVKSISDSPDLVIIEKLK